MQPIINRFAEAVLWYRHHGEGFVAGHGVGIEGVELREKLARRFLQIATRTQIGSRRRRIRAKAEQNLIIRRSADIEP